METKHTKQPWSVSENSCEIISIESSSVTHVAICLNNFKLGDSIETTLKHISESRANIKLIVAAPELLEVCIHIVESYKIQGLITKKKKEKLPPVLRFV